MLHYAAGGLSARDLVEGAHRLKHHPDLAMGDLAFPLTYGNVRPYVDKALGLDHFEDNRVYWGKLPGHCKKTGKRIWFDHPFLLPLDTIVAICEAGHFVSAPADLLSMPFLEGDEVLWEEKTNINIVERLSRGEW